MRVTALGLTVCLFQLFCFSRLVQAQNENVPKHSLETHILADSGSLPRSSETPSTPLPLGRSLRRNEFLLNYTNFNHGSFGACPKSVLEYQASLRLEQEQQPDVWFRQQYFELQNATRKKVANYVGIYDDLVDSLVLVESASTAINSIMRSFPWVGGDMILMFSVAYPMVQNTAEWLAHEHGLEIVRAPVSFPISDEDGEDAFLRPMQQALEQLKLDGNLSRLKMVVLDHIVSCPGVTEPIAELAAMIKSYASSCFVLVDGAHVMGQVQSLNLTAIANMDAYLSNGHKWLYSPKGSAFLWVNQTSGFVTDYFPEPTVISSANPIGATMLSQRYAYVSSREYTAFLTMGAAIDFRQHTLGGDQVIYEYCRNQALQAKHLLMDLWSVRAMAPDSMEEFMINIELPSFIDSRKRGRELMEYLLQKHGIYMIALQDITSRLFYTRLSAQVYLELWDFERFGNLVLQFGKDMASSSNVIAEYQVEKSGQSVS